MKKRLLILGSAGMVGHMTNIFLRETKKYEIFDSSFPLKVTPESILLDAFDRNQLGMCLNSVKPDIVINCIGILIKGSIADPATTVYLNSFLPHYITSLLRKQGHGRLINISTDCVFSGIKGYYIESDIPDARDTYGLSKALGEVINTYDLTLRTSIIGPELNPKGEGLFNWFMSQKSEVKGYSNVIWGGVTSLEIAKAIDLAVEQEIKGLYHLTPGYSISKYDLLMIINNIWNKARIRIIPVESKGTDKSLKTNRTDFKYIATSYEFMLKELYDFMINHKNLYPHYCF